MKVVSWNVNSLRARFDRVTDFLATREPDILCIQETKCKDENFPEFDIRTLGYDVCHYGLSQYNGVAIISKEQMTDIVAGMGNDADPYIADARIIRADIGTTTYVSVYVPNGRDVTSEHYEMKLEWYDHFAEYLRDVLASKENVVVVGDFNVAPRNDDVWDIDNFPITTHVTEREREKLQALFDLGFTDAYRHIYPEEQGFSFWDYRGGDFHMNRGMRIDLCLVTKGLVDAVKDVTVDRESRKGEKPSDHAAVVIDLDL